MASSSSSLHTEKRPIFVDTNLGTHLAMAASPEITAGELKRIFGNEHFICFPSIGEIRITGLMVKRRSYFYHLPDSFPVKNVFLGLEGPWFLHMDVTPLNLYDKPVESRSLAAECRIPVPDDSNTTNYRKPENHTMGIVKIKAGNSAKKRKKKGSCKLHSEGPLENFQTPVNISKENKTSNKCFREIDESNDRLLPVSKECLHVPPQEGLYDYDSSKKVNRKEGWASQTPSGSLCDVVSVSGIIERYYPEFDEVKSCDDSAGCDVNVEFGVRAQQDRPLSTESDEQCSKMQIHDTLCTSNSPAACAEPNSGTSKGKLGKRKVGKCAAKYCHSTSKTKPFITGCKSKKQKLSSSFVTPPCTAKAAKLSLPPSAGTNPRTSARRLARTEVGKRFILAANDLQVSTSKKKPFITTCKSEKDRLSSLAKHLVFEIDSEVPTGCCS